VNETYFPLSGKKLEEFRHIVARKKYQKVQDTELTWADKLILEGKEKGREEGVVQGKREPLKRQLIAKFGPLLQDVETRIDAIESGAELDGYLDRVLTAQSLGELGLDS
jgi:hypothetical protein